MFKNLLPFFFKYSPFFKKVAKIVNLAYLKLKKFELSKILFFTTFWKNKTAINNFLSPKCFIIRSLQMAKFDFEKDSLGFGHCTPFEFSFANSSFTPITIQFPTLRINFTQEKNLVKNH